VRKDETIAVVMYGGVNVVRYRRLLERVRENKKRS